MLSSNQDLPLWDWDSLAPTSEPIITVFLFGIGIASSTSEPIQLVWDSCAAGGLLQLKLHRHRCSVARSHVVGFAPVGGRIVVTVDWLAPRPGDLRMTSFLLPASRLCTFQLG